MNTTEKKDLFESLSRIFSFLFHPLLMPVYGLVIIFTAPTILGYLPFQVKKLMFLIVLVNNVFLPMALMPFFYHRNIITSWTIDDRRERIIPLVITTVLYASTSFIIFRFPVPFFLKSYIFASLFISLVVTVINLWWKISLHSVGAGALLATVLVLSYRMNVRLEWYPEAVIILGGIILSSRLKLNFHNPPQVWLGFLTGVLGLTLFMMFI